MNGLLALPIHVWDREVDARICLAACALLDGLDVIFGHEYNISPLYQTVSGIFSYGAGRPIFNKPRTTHWYEPIVSNNGFVGLVFEEGVNDVLFNVSRAFSGINSRSVSSTSKYFAWCDAEISHLLSAAPPALRLQLQSICKPSSNSRIDLLGNIGYKYFSTFIQSINTLFDNFVLISDNFGLEPFGCREATPFEQKYKEIVSRYVSVNDANLRSTSIQRDIEMYLNTKASREKFASVIASIVSSNPDINFVFRPHPISDPGFWEATLPRSRNLTIFSKHNIIPWLKACSGFIHAGCTIGFEAELSNIPAIDVSNLYSDDRDLGLGTTVSRYLPSDMSETNIILREIWKARNLSNTSNQFSTFSSIDECFNQNLDSLNASVFSSVNFHNVGLPFVSGLSQIRNSYLEFFRNSQFRSNWGKYRSDLSLIRKIIGPCPQPPLAGKSRFYSIHEIQSRLNSALNVFSSNPPKVRVVQFSRNNVFYFSRM